MAKIRPKMTPYSCWHAAPRCRLSYIFICNWLYCSLQLLDFFPAIVGTLPQVVGIVPTTIGNTVILMEYFPTTVGNNCGSYLGHLVPLFAQIRTLTLCLAISNYHLCNVHTLNYVILE